MADRIRVLIADDSAFARKVLREVLSASPHLEVVGIARDGLEALEKAVELKPDVLTLDLVMPNLDGLGVLAALPQDGPRVVIVSMAGEDSALGIAALHAGAVDLVHKPTALATDRLYELGDELVNAVRSAAQARNVAHAAADSIKALRAPATTTQQILVVGASTGGPQALTRLLKALPANFPAPVALVLHLPPGYTGPFAERLDRECPLDVAEASEGLALRPGLVVVARAGLHLVLQRGAAGGAVAHLAHEPASSPHRPSVDELFLSAAQVFGKGVLGVVLTGMGNDGTAGSRAIRAAGGAVLTEAAASCVVYGMPRSVDEAGLSSGSVMLGGMAEAVISRL